MPRAMPAAGLDAAAERYARLLADPCNSELCPSIMAGANGALVVRVERDEILNSSATDIGSCGYYCPGAMSASAVRNAIGTGGPWSSDTIPAALVNATASRQPGYNFLAANSSGVRCIAGCIQVMFVGTELQRAGVMAVGCTKLSNLTGTSSTLADLRGQAQIVTKTPDGFLEYRLPPTEAAELFRDPNNPNDNTFDPATQDLPALFWSVSGIPVSTGVRVRYVAVYEWVPKQAVGLVAPQMAAVAPSRNTKEDVLRHLSKFGDWLANGIGTVSPFGAFTVKALAKGAGMYSSYLNKNRPNM